MKRVNRTSEEKRPRVKMKWRLSELVQDLTIITFLTSVIVFQLCHLVKCDIITQNRLTYNGDNSAEELSSSSSSSSGYQRPKFAPLADDERRVVASRWQNEVFLPCRILNLDEDQTVSWIRKRDSLVMTVDKLNLVNDQRFQLAQSEQNWTLVVKQPNEADAGLYECQVSSVEPKLSQLIELRMVNAESRISNFSSLYIRPNDQINLTCTIEAPQKTDFVYWYKNKESIYFDDLRHSNPLTKSPNRQQSGDFFRYVHRQVFKRKTHPTGGDNDDHDHDERGDHQFDDHSIVRASPSSKEVPSDHVTSGRSVGESGVPFKKGRGNDEKEEGAVFVGETMISTTRIRRKSSRLQLKGGQRKENAQNIQHQQQEQQNEDTNNGKKNEKDNQEKIESITSVSRLVIERAQANDTANYTCLPSNAKPSHINIVVVVENNGLQSQPEKRSLQASDGAISSLNGNSCHYLAKLIAQQCAMHLKLVLDWMIETVIEKGVESDQVQFMPGKIRKVQTETGILDLIFQLAASQDFQRLTVILITTSYINL